MTGPGIPENRDAITGDWMRRALVAGGAPDTPQFFRLVSSATGLALLGGVLAMRLAARLAAGLSDEVRAVLAPGQIEALQSNPRVLDDPATADALRASLAEAGPAGAQAADALSAGLNTAITGAVGDAFALSAAVTAVSVVAALFLGAGRDHATGVS